MVTLKLSRWIEKRNDIVWVGVQIKRIKQDAGHALIIEDVPYTVDDSRGNIKKLLLDRGVKDIRFKTLEPRETVSPEQIIGNHKTFREFFAGKHPDCDIRYLGRPGEELWMGVARLTQAMADYMDYIAERIIGR